MDRLHRRVYAIKGVPGQRPIWARVHSKGRKNRQPLWIVGVDGAKEGFYSRLKIAEHGPGFCHFPVGDQYEVTVPRLQTWSVVVLRFKGGK